MTMAANFNIDNAHSRDCRLCFEPEGHTYTAVCDDGRQVPCDSVTMVIDSFFEQFDADYWAGKKAPAMGMTPRELKELWQRKGQTARDLGTALHARIENHYLGNEEPSGPNDAEYKHFIAFETEHSLMPYRTEWPIFSEKYRIAGTIDFVERRDGVFNIWDWKRSSKLISGGEVVDSEPFGKCGYGPAASVPDTPYHHYCLQLGLYRAILAMEYGIKVDKMRLGVFHPDYDRPYVVELPFLRNQVIAILNSRLDK